MGPFDTKIRSILAAMICVTIATPLAAQPWPTRTLRIVTATPAGGSPDFVSRLLADKLTDRLGQAVVVENAAVSGVAAWNNLAKAQPDGHTVGMLTGAFSARAAVAKSLPYDPIKDFAFVTMVSGYPMVVATAPSSPIKSFGDLIARAKAAPDTITYGMNAPGSVHHLIGELINVEAGTSMRGIPYRGNTQIVQDLLGGRLDVMVETGTVAFAQIKGGTLRGLAVSSRERFALEPDIPAIAETLPGFEVISWLGLAMPAGTPRPIARSAKFSSLRISGQSSPASAMSRPRPRPKKCWTISRATPPVGAGSSRSRRSSGIDRLSHRTPAACRYCRSTNRSAAGSGGLITPPSPMNAITWASPLRSISAALGMTPLSGSK
jgi:tripartite-type tricarboxylate transporter receptor subunit TctC